jgi:WD40 repeat protein
MNEREIFTLALQQPDVAAREAFLNQACGDDAALRERVNGLLAAHQQLESFMDSPSSVDTVDRPISEAPGMLVRPILAAGLLLLALLVGIAGTTWGLLRAQKAAEAERLARMDAQKKGKEAEQQRARAELREQEATDAMRLLGEEAEKNRRLLFNTHTRLAQQAWDSNDVAQARFWLDQPHTGGGEVDLRGFAWYYYNRLCHLERSLDHGTQCFHVDFAPDGSLLASVGGGKVKVWDVVGQTLKYEFEHPSARFVTFSPDATMLVCAPNVQLWTIEPFERVATFDEASQGFFSPDNRLLAIIVNSEVRLFDIARQTQIATLRGHTENVSSVSFSPDSTRIATGSADKTAKVWDVKDGTLNATLDKHDLYVDAVGFWQNSSQLLTIQRGGPVRLWDLTTQQEMKRFQEPTGLNVEDVILSHDGKLLALVNNFSNLFFVDVWDLASGKKVRRIEKPGTIVASFATKAPLFAVANNYEHSIELWNTESWMHLKTFKFADLERFWFYKKHSVSPAGDLMAFANGSSVLLFGLDGADHVPATPVIGGFDIASNRSELIFVDQSQLKTFDFSANTVTHQFQITHDLCLEKVSIASNGSRIAASVFRKSEVYIWRSVDSQPQTLPLTTDQESQKPSDVVEPRVQALALSPSGRFLAVSGERIPLQIHDTESRQVVAELGNVGPVNLLAVSDTGTIVAVASGSEVTLWDAPMRTRIGVLRGLQSDVLALTFSRDGQYLAIADIWSAEIWNVSKQERLHSVVVREQTSDPPMFGRMLAFMPDGSSLMVGSTERVLQVDVATGQTIATLETIYWEDNIWNLRRSNGTSWTSSDSEVTLVTVSNKGDRIAAQCGDGRVFVWRLSDRTGVAATRLASPAVDLTFAEHGDELIAGSTRLQLLNLNTVSWRDLPSPSGAASISHFAYSPYEQKVATASSSTWPDVGRTQIFADVKIWDVAAARVVTQIRAKNGIAALAFAPRSSVLAIAGVPINDGRMPTNITFWDTNSGQFLGELQGSAQPLAFSTDDEIVAGGGGVRGLEMPDGKFKFSFSHDRAGTFAFFPGSPGRSRLATAGDDGIIKIWDYESRKELATLTGHFGAVLALEFSPDGASLASGGADSRVRIWDLATYTEVVALDLKHEVQHLRFAADGKTLAALREDGAIEILRGSAE